jgi:eukaryotic-like serine/threonine-protein kinase
VPRPVSGGQGIRGAASVPPHQQQQQQPYRHPGSPAMPHMPMAPTKQAESSGSRQVLIVLAVVLALLVLLCAGVISFLLRQSNANALGAAGQTAAAASYRLTNQAGIPPSLLPATEGRQTL